MTFKSVMFSTLMRRIVKGLLLGASASLKLWAQEPATAPVAARDLARGTILVAADVRADSLQAAQLTGWEVRRVIKAGEAIKAPAVTAPALVTANGPVTLEATVNGVRISRAATALARGTLGDRIPIRLDSQRTITAIVSGRGTVRTANGTD
jgi:flagella basal body P-ring formation protein FlgA